MKITSDKLLHRCLVYFLIILGIIYAASASSDVVGHTTNLTPDFHVEDQSGDRFSLADFKGEPLILHITNIENPLCIECEESLKSQIEELQKLKEMHPNVTLITLNMRKNPYSKDGKTLAESWWNAKITWRWVEDFDPFPVAGKYIDYWSRENGFANPTIILIDNDGRIAGFYHVYQMGEGQIDGIQDAESLYQKIEQLEDGQWNNAIEREIAAQEVTFLGMFSLGIITSLAPCSLALLIAVFSYLMTTHRRKILGPDDDKSSPKDGLMIGIAFTMGMAMVFFFIGLFISNLGIFVRDSRFFDLAAGLLMITLGITSFKPLGEILEPVTSRLPSFGDEDLGDIRNKKTILERLINISMALFKHSAFIGAFTLGVFFALGWAPCAISLVFPVLIWLMSQDISPLTGGLMLFVFGVGHGVPIIPISTFSRTFCGAIGERYISMGKWISGGFGLLIIATGVVFSARYFGYTFW